MSMCKSAFSYFRPKLTSLPGNQRSMPNPPTSDWTPVFCGDGDYLGARCPCLHAWVSQVLSGGSSLGWAAPVPASLSLSSVIFSYIGLVILTSCNHITEWIRAQVQLIQIMPLHHVPAKLIKVTLKGLHDRSQLHTGRHVNMLSMSTHLKCNTTCVGSKIVLVLCCCYERLGYKNPSFYFSKSVLKQYWKSYSVIILFFPAFVGPYQRQMSVTPMCQVRCKMR